MTSRHIAVIKDREEMVSIGDTCSSRSLVKKMASHRKYFCIAAVWRVVLLFALCSTGGLIRLVGSSEVTRTCEPIRIDMCKSLGYNITGMPNLVGHELQQDAQLQLQTFAPLVQYGCSSRLRFFLCSVYVPMCTEKVPQPIGPCRPLCEDAKARCEPVLLEFGFPWPSALNCSQYPPENNDKHMCMEGPELGEHEKSRTRVFNRDRRPSRVGIHRTSNINSGRPVLQPPTKRRSQHYGLCQKLSFSEQYYYINRTGRCAPLCTADILFTKDNKDFAEIWVAVWAGACFISTLFTVLTFLADVTRFSFPERAIVFLSINYNSYSIAYFIRLIAGRNEVACHMDSQYNVPILIQEGLDNINCTIVFMLLYFFGMASAAWWVVLTITWFLAAGLRWSHEAIERRSSYFHLVAWVLPSAKTIAVLVLRVIDADELTGMCYVGNQNPQTLMQFVLIPSFAYLLIGAVFLIAGAAAIFRSRNQRPQQRSLKSEKVEVMMVRVGIFASLYIVPATCVVAAHFYEYSSREGWLLATSSSQPNVEIFTLKIFMSLVVGITTGLWVWSSKTPLNSWRKVGKRLSPRKQPLPPYLKAVPRTYILPVVEKPKKFRVKAGSETIV